jgi:phage tail-like protein
MQTATKPASVLLNYLPAIYQESGWGGGDTGISPFLNNFLLAFEKVLLGRNDGIELRDGSPQFPGASPPRFQGLEEKVASLHTLFDAGQTPGCFLDWLASWCALTLRMELTEPTRRTVLANIIPLYRIRGTRKYMERLLALFVGGGITVDDEPKPGFQIGRHSTIAKDTYVGGNAPHYFHVRLSRPSGDESRNAALLRLTHELIELAKPAHTHYTLELLATRFQLGIHSQVGADTILA